MTLVFLVQPSKIDAEPYIAGFAGYGLSAELSDVTSMGDIKGSDLGLQNSPIYGVNVGYFLDNLKYFGWEAEVYSATPFLKQQHFTFDNPPGSQSSIVAGGHLRVTTAAFNVVYRYPGELVQPYAGVGGGLFWFTNPSSTAGSALRPGINVLAGTRLFVTRQIALFGEYKYNHSSFPSSAGGLLKADYNAHFVVFGVGFHF